MPSKWAPGTQLLREKNAEGVKRFFTENPELLDCKLPFAGGDWMHFAASESDVACISILESLGVDINAQGRQEKDRPIVRAAHRDKIENAKYLLEQGAILDTDASVRNPLFASVIGKSPEIAQLLLDYGIDTEVRYHTDTMKGLNAAGFALLHGQDEIVLRIARHVCGEDEKAQSKYIKRAARYAGLAGPLRKVQILPSLED